MKRIVLMMALAMAGCGYTSVNNEIIGQPKKLVNLTPVICPNRVDVDISLGIMRNGVGSMSTQDLWLTVPNQTHRDLLNQAVRDGKVVKVLYNDRRITLCEQMEEVTGVEIL